MLLDASANHKKRDTGEVPIDYEHAIEVSAGSGGPVPAAGWIKTIDDEPDADGILWGSVEWTPRAAEMIKAGEYKYISPVLDPNVRDNKTGAPQGWTLTSAALTNKPILQGMPALVLSEDGWNEDRGDAEKAGSVKVKKLIMADRVAGTVRAVLDDDTEVTVKLEGLEAAPKVLRLSDVKRDAKSNEFDFALLDTTGDVLVAGEVFRAQQVQMVLSEAVKAGKITPAQRPLYEKMALSDLTALVATMKPQIDLGVKGTGATEGTAADVEVEGQVAKLVREKIAASEGKSLEYGEALRLVLSGNADLARQYSAQMGRAKK